MVRMIHDPVTRDYVEKRRAEERPTERSAASSSDTSPEASTETSPRRQPPKSALTRYRSVIEASDLAHRLGPSSGRLRGSSIEQFISGTRRNVWLNHRNVRPRPGELPNYNMLYERRQIAVSKSEKRRECVAQRYAYSMSLPRPEPLIDHRQSLADLIYEHLIQLIESGVLKPGQRVNDLELAEAFGYSRTPVREALQRLRGIGAVETSAQRYTRIVEVSPEQMQHCLVVWIALARALAREIVGYLTDDDFAILAKYSSQFHTNREAGDARATALSAFRFAEHLTRRSRNPELRRAIGSVVYIILIGSLELPAWLDARLVEQSLVDITDGLRRGDISAVEKALEHLSELDVVHLAPEEDVAVAEP